MKRTASLLLALTVLTGAMWSCESKSSSSSSTADSTSAVSAETTSVSATAAEPAQKVTEAETLAGYNYYDTEDGMFRIGFADNFKEYSGGDMDSCELTLTPDGLSLVSFTSVCGKHFTAMGFAGGLVEDFKSSFDNVALSETTANGLPAARITADRTKDGVDYAFEYLLIQYGNGDLFVLAKGIPDISSYAIDIEEILRNVEYKGEPLSESDSEIDGKTMHMTVDKKFYVYGADDKFKVRYNLSDSDAQYTSGLNISTETGGSAASVADRMYEKWGTTDRIKNLSRDKAEFMGRECEHITYLMDVTVNDVNADWYAFDENGTVYIFTLLYPDSMAQQLKSDIQPVLDSFEIK